MPEFENTFVRGSSPSYSEDVNSENRMSTLPIGDRNSLSASNFVKKAIGRYDYMQHNMNSKGRNTFAFWTLVILLFILTIGNLLLTITIIGVLRLGKGMESIELIPEEEIVKFFGVADLDRIYKRDGNIEGFVDEPVNIVGEANSVTVNVNRHGSVQSRMHLDDTGISFKGISSFEVKDPNSGDVIFTTHRPRYVMPKGAESLNAKVISATCITSPIGKPLTVQADDKLSVRGSEGLFMESQAFLLTAGNNVFINATQGSTTLSGVDSIFLDMDSIPVINSEHGIRTGVMQYKICICMPQGKLFRVAVPRNHSGKITCTHFNPKHDPCF